MALKAGDSVIIRGTVSQVERGHVTVITDKKIERYPEGTAINLHESQIEKVEDLFGPIITGTASRDDMLAPDPATAAAVKPKGKSAR